MTETESGVRAGADNGAGERRGRRPLNKRSDSSSQGLVAPDRAPRLRRIADLITAKAADCANPDHALRLARDMRVRASQLEVGADLVDPIGDLIQQMQELPTLLA